MADDPQTRFEQDQRLDPRIDTPGREGLTGTARGDIYEATRDPEDVTIAPDQRPMHEQPSWRQDFAIDWPEDNFIARRDFARFLVLTSGAFVAGQVWIAAHSLVRSRRPPPGRLKIGSLAATPAGSATMFAYPTAQDPCLLIRTREGALLAYSQKCTHLSCAVVPRLDEGLLRCPCHEGIFDLATGRNLAGPPPRPLPAIELEVVGDDIFAIAVKERMV
jgi:Rieske Fe-S protein